MSIADRPAALFAGVEPLEVFVELLADIDMHTSPTEFYDRICEAICRLTTMRRAAVFMADAARRRVRAIGVLTSVGRSVASSDSEVPCAPTARTRRREASAMKIAARCIVVNRQIASQIRS